MTAVLSCVEDIHGNVHVAVDVAGGLLHVGCVLAVSQAHHDGIPLGDGDDVLTEHAPEVGIHLPLVVHDPDLETVIVQGTRSPLVLEIGGGTRGLAHVVAGNQLATVPVALVQHQAGKTGYFPGRGMETAESLLVAILAIEQPIGITASLHGAPEFLGSIVADGFAGGRLNHEGEQLSVAAPVGELPSRFLDHVKAGDQIVEVIAVVAVSGHGKEGGVGLVPAQSAAHREKIANGNIPFLPLVEGGNIIPHGIVKASDFPLVEGRTDEQSDDAFRGGKDIGCQGIVPTVAVFLVNHAVVLYHEKGYGTEAVYVGAVGGTHPVGVAVTG